MEHNHILAATDFSEFSTKAVEFALSLGKQFQARVTLVHALEPYEEDEEETARRDDGHTLAQKEEGALRRKVQPYLDKAAAAQIPADFVLLRGFNPADALLHFLGENRFDLVVSGTHGRSGLKHLFQGSVAEKLVRMSPIPVLTVHQSVENFHLRRILVPIDFSLPSRAALDAAGKIAGVYGARLILFHAIEQEIYPSFYSEGEETLFDIDRNLPRIVRENLQEFVADSLNLDLVEDYVVKKGLAHQEIVDYAKKNRIDLLVIATHGLNGMEYLLLGNTAEKVIRQATCPVLTVKRNA